MDSAVKTFMAVFILTLFLVESGMAGTYTEGVFTYSYSDGIKDSGVLTQCSQSTGTVLVPTTFTPTFSQTIYKVRTIGDGRTAPFYTTPTLNIALQDTVTKLASYSLAYLKQSNFSIPATVTVIDSYAFYGCPNLLTINIPSGVTSLGSYAFRGCIKLSNITIPSTVSSIGDGAFYQTDITSITIPSSVRTFGKSVFSTCTKLTSCVLPNTINAIPEGTFYGCGSMSTFGFPSSITSIGNQAFAGCSFSTLQIPSTVTSIGDYAFNQCKNLLSITIPTSVVFIGTGAFAGCVNLNNVVIPNTLTSIGDSWFAGDTSLDNITIPTSVTSIGNSAFGGCNALLNFTLPNGITSIGNSAFSYCINLASINIPASVTTIQDAAFYGCRSLQYIKIPPSVSSLGNSTFVDCPALARVYFFGAPPLSDYPFDTNQAAKTTGGNLPLVFYTPNSVGWVNSFGGRPTTVIQPSSASPAFTESGVFKIDFDTLPGFTYGVQSSSDLMTWNYVQSNIQGDGMTKTYTESNIAGDKMFYRVVLQY